MDDDESYIDTIRELAKKGVKAFKRMKHDENEAVKEDVNAKSRSGMAAQLELHTRVASMRLVMQYGNVEQREMVLADILKTNLSANE